MKSVLLSWRLNTLSLACLFVGVFLCSQSVDATELKRLRIAYVGSERAEEFVRFLEDHVASVESFSREKFDPSGAEKFDVVLLDWPQSSDARAERERMWSPLGKREDWNRPTVLLGSAGLNLACVWQLRGGSGCTCLDPVAYDLMAHPIFEEPFAIDRGATITIETPSSFQDDMEEKSIDVIPIVDDFKKKWRAGWCTYSTAFDVFPDVEFFCGGVNHKTPTAAAIWRQGNLMHFGFQPSPKEMNDTGDRLLLNAIAYISHFSDDRPIAISPSVFVGPRVRPRKTVASWLKNPQRRDWVKNLVAEDLWETIQSQGEAESMISWAREHTPYFTPDTESKIAIDPDLKTMQMGFDDAGFIEAAIEALACDIPADKERAIGMLNRYVPEGPRSGDASSWQRWHEENKPYLFATDFGHFRWYIDPLAKQRKIPTIKLRGPDRMDKR